MWGTTGYLPPPPFWILDEGISHPDLGWRYPPLYRPGMGVPSPSRPEIGYSPFIPGNGVPHPCFDLRKGYFTPRPDLGWGTPHKCEQTDTCEDSTFARTSFTGLNKLQQIKYLFIFSFDVNGTVIHFYAKQN